jgi:hypothetical protein
MTFPVISCVNFKQDVSWGYIDGYKRAAQLLRDQMLVEQHYLDSLIYPLGYLYRHHVELQLKWLIEHASWLRDTASFPKRTHKLSVLWAELNEILEEIAPDEQVFCNELSTDLTVLSLFDDSAENFRYRTDTKGNNS